MPARPEGAEVAVSTLGPWSTGAHERVQPVQDWMTVRLDEKPEQADAPTVLAPVRKLHRGGGQPPKPIYLQERAPEETYDMWSGTCLRRGPGLTTITRCLDGDRMGQAPHMVEPGDRFFLSGAPPFVERLYDYRPLWEAGQVVLAREYPCVLARIA